MLPTRKNVVTAFFEWYQRNYRANLYLATFLFAWQLVHLYWMFSNVIMLRIFGVELWEVGKAGNLFISLVDYTEIPALILTSIFYLGELRREFRTKYILFLVLLNSQWLHLFWITDEVVIAQFTGTAAVALPAWLAWSAIFIDYLELPIIYDTVKKAIKSLRK